MSPLIRENFSSVLVPLISCPCSSALTLSQNVAAAAPALSRKLRRDTRTRTRSRTLSLASGRSCRARSRGRDPGASAPGERADAVPVADLQRGCAGGFRGRIGRGPGRAALPHALSTQTPLLPPEPSDPSVRPPVRLFRPSR